MKPRDIQRGISSRSVRLGGEAPAIGKVPRVRRKVGGSSDGKGRRRRREERQAAAKRRSVLIFSSVLGVVALAAIGFAPLAWFKGVRERSREDDKRTTVVEEALKASEKSKFPSPTEEEALSIVKNALANRDPLKVPSLVRSGPTSPEEIVAFLSESDERDGPLDKFRWLSSMDSDGMLIEGVLVTFKNPDKRSERLALLTPDEKGTWRVDFDAYRRTVDVPWDSLLSKKTDRARVRVMVASDLYYNGVFSDDKKWVCYAMASPDVEGLLRGYCLRGSPEADLMASIIEPADNAVRRFNSSEVGGRPRSQKTGRVILDLVRPEGADSRQFQISGVVAREWLMPDGADTASNAKQ